jgi:hypothetical protein
MVNRRQNAGRRREGHTASFWLILTALICSMFAFASVPRSLAEDIDVRRMPAVLVMVGDPGCPYCAQWKAEVKIPYARSPEGAFAPLVELLRGDPSLRGVERIVYSPTFLVLSNGVEVGRIVGYQGADLFWMELEPLMAKAGFQPSGALLR